MDKYTKFILTIIAVAMIGILFKGEIIKEAHASSVGTVCVAGYKFAISNANSNIVQIFYNKNGQKSLPMGC